MPERQVPKRLYHCNRATPLIRPGRGQRTTPHDAQAPCISAGITATGRQVAAHVVTGWLCSTAWRCTARPWPQGVAGCCRTLGETLGPVFHARLPRHRGAGGRGR